MRALEKLAAMFKETSAVSGKIIAPPREMELKAVKRQTTRTATFPRVQIEHNIHNKVPKIPTQQIATLRIL